MATQNKTHALVHNGTPHDEVGYELTDPKVTTGEGRAKCKCGWLSEELGSGAARREAYKRHLTEPNIDQDDPEPTGTDEDLIGEPVKAPEKAPKPVKAKAAPKAPKEPKEPRGLVEATGPYVDIVFEFTPTWLFPSLGVYGAQARDSAAKGITASTDAGTRTVRFAGASERRVQAVADLLVAAWEEQVSARRAMKKVEPDFLAVVAAKPERWKPILGQMEHDWCRTYMDAIAALVKGEELPDTPGGRSVALLDFSAEVKAARR